MSKRERIRKSSGKGGVYAQRVRRPKSERGRFKNITNIGKSINADKRRKAKTTPTRPGYGHTGDY